jgi:hypothetical protein
MNAEASKIVKLRVLRDERYPVFTPLDVGHPLYEKGWEVEVELSEEEWKFVQKATQDFDKAQHILEQAYEKAYSQKAKASKVSFYI